MERQSVNVSLENVGPCKKLIRIEVPVDRVKTEYDRLTRETQRQARIPGFRPGKAPLPLVLKSLSQHIESELKRTLVQKCYREAVEQHQLRPITSADIEDQPWSPGQPLCFTATVEIEPEFELPDYKLLPVRRDSRVVSTEDVHRAVAMFRDQKSQFIDVARPIQNGDFVVVNYTGTCEGKPITELAPTAQGLTEQKNFWLQVDPEGFIPGFTPQLVGASAGEKRPVTVTFPADFVTRELAGKPGLFDVEIVQVKEKQLPPLDDALAKSLGAENLDRLQEVVKANLEVELKGKQQRLVRDQLVARLLSRVNIELPESLVDHETRNAVYDIVRANQERGVTKESIDERKEEIYSVANNNARERVKAMIILGRVAAKEGITTTKEEVLERVARLAAAYQVKPDKFLRQLHERGALGQVQRQIIEAKVLDALELYAQVEDAPTTVS